MGSEPPVAATPRCIPSGKPPAGGQSMTSEESDCTAMRATSGTPSRCPVGGRRSGSTPPNGVAIRWEKITCGGSAIKMRPTSADLKNSGHGNGYSKGSKNKKTLEREVRAAAALAPKRGRGRPKDSKNKKTLEREAMLAARTQTPESALTPPEKDCPRRRSTGARKEIFSSASSAECTRLREIRGSSEVVF